VISRKSFLEFMNLIFQVGSAENTK